VGNILGWLILFSYLTYRKASRRS